MDIDTLGEKTIAFLFEKKFIRDISGLYTFDYHQRIKEEGFKEKKIANIKQSVAASKNQPFSKVLTSLGFDGIGTSAVKDLLLNGFNSIDKIIDAAKKSDVETFADIEGFGEITANLLIQHFTDEQNLELIQRLKQLGLNFHEALPGPSEDEHPQPFKDQVWVITGSFQQFNPRSKAAQEIEKRGGKVTGSVSTKTTHLLAGESAGSKLTKAQKLDIPIIDEAAFIAMLS
jgi:DNA ligase (NAD+)